MSKDKRSVKKSWRHTGGSAGGDSRGGGEASCGGRGASVTSTVTGASSGAHVETNTTTIVILPYNSTIANVHVSSQEEIPQNNK